MKKRKLVYSMTCALGGGFVGFFAGKLNEVYGSILFTLGVAMMVFSIIKLSK